MSSLRRDVEFVTADGVTLRGWFYGVSHCGKHPCVIMANGLAGLKEQLLPSFAQRFQAAKYCVLLYDHRNWGASDGLPRNETDPIQQARDFSDAFDFAASLPEVDAAKIVYWGSSMCGGVVLYAAAFDKRIRAVVSQVPFVSGELLVPLLTPMLGTLYAGRQQAKAGNSLALIEMFADSSESAQQGSSNALLKDPNVAEFLRVLEKQSLPWAPNVTPQTLLHLLAFEPRAFIHRIAPTPLLLVVADSDHTAPTFSQLNAFASAYEPKTLSILHNTGHFDPYHGKGFERNIEAQLSFLNEVL